MVQTITMKMRDGRQGAITVERVSGGSFALYFNRPGSPSVGVGLTESQTRLLLDALQVELAEPR